MIPNSSTKSQILDVVRYRWAEIKPGRYGNEDRVKELVEHRSQEWLSCWMCHIITRSGWYFTVLSLVNCLGAILEKDRSWMIYTPQDILSEGFRFIMSWPARLLRGDDVERKPNRQTCSYCAHIRYLNERIAVFSSFYFFKSVIIVPSIFPPSIDWLVYCCLELLTKRLAVQSLFILFSSTAPCDC